MFVFRHLLDDEVRQLQSLQTQTPELSAATDDALQDRGGDDGTGQVQLSHLKRPATPGNKQTTIRFTRIPQTRQVQHVGVKQTHSLGACESQLLYVRPWTAQPRHLGFQDVPQSRVCLGHTLQIHAVPQRLVEPGTDTTTWLDFTRFNSSCQPFIRRSDINTEILLFIYVYILHFHTYT